MTENGTTETRRWSARHCRGRCVSQVCRTHVSPPVQPPSRGRNTPIPIRLLHDSRHRVCVAHMVQALTSMDHSATILSVDGVGAYGSISQRDVSGCCGHGGWREDHPFHSPVLRQSIRVFVGGRVRKVIQGEGRPQNATPLQSWPHRALVSSSVGEGG